MERADSLRGAIERLATLDRGSCSRGEHEAAEWIATALREQGAQVEIERERVHGTYWWPLGLTSALGLAGLLAGRRGGRVLGAVLGLAGTMFVIDDLTMRSRLLRRFLPKQMTANVVARMGEIDAKRTVVVVAHHDAAHSSIFFHPRLAAVVGDVLKPAADAPSRAPALMMPIAAGPAIAGLGALTGWRRVRELGAFVCGGIIASFVEIAVRPPVPGANDNLSGVAVLLALARALRERPVHGLRVLLVSTGSEEALMEGMRAFAARHFGELDRDATDVLCVDILGSPHLVLAEAEGMLRLRGYDPGLKDLIERCAREQGTPLRRGLKIRFGTDGFLALRHGLRGTSLTSVNDHWAPSNYHWPSDTPEQLDYEALAAASRLCERVVRALADGAAPRA